MSTSIRYATLGLALAAIALFGTALAAYLDAGRVRDIMANGMEATAEVEGGRLGVRQASGDDYTVDVVWQDAAGTRHAAKGLPVTGVLGRQLMAGEAGDPPTLLIKFDAAAPGRGPVIVRQAALDQEVNARRLAWGALAGMVCLLASAVLALLARRRRHIA